MDAQPVAGRHLAQIFTVSRRLPLAGGGCGIPGKLPLHQDDDNWGPFLSLLSPLLATVEPRAPGETLKGGMASSFAVDTCWLRYR
ncbi:hypothetical protein H634G_05671 [Metarhizium anisopliae BRIP 53293]|uniref:Uncharacterized protein n=1 Tax=Metarhizium anisopliae BRIP 53293 TaxID=1291518 RepID=A0A0D9NXX1_METAN|nr:hypothetical protein H634G_05671 [Metarhizium anisopliae BRIP 53293]